MKVGLISIVRGKHSDAWQALVEKTPDFVYISDAKLPIPGVHVSNEGGIAAGLNRAIAQLSDCDALAFVPADASFPYPLWLQAATTALEQQTTVGAVDFYIVQAGKILHGGGAYNGRTPIRISEGEKVGETQARNHESGWTEFTACVVRMDALRKIGSLRYTDDWQTFFGQQVAARGMKCITLGAPIEVAYGLLSNKISSKSVRWRGPIFDSSGYAAEGRLLIQWLPPTHQLSIAPLQWESQNVRTDQRLASLVQSRLADQSSADVTITHGFPTVFDRLPGYNIGRTMYETTKLNPDWVAGLQKMDEIWAPSGFCQEVLGQYHPKVELVYSPIDVDTYRPTSCGFGSLKKGNEQLRIPSETQVCRFLFFSEWIKRKGWRELCDAFQDAFTDEPVEMVFKTYSAMGKTTETIKQDIASRLGRPFRYIGEILTDTELARLYNSCHCLLHPAHGEGFGRTVAEALACGIEAISIAETGLKEIQRHGIAGTSWVDVPVEAYDEMWHSTEGGHQWVDIPHDALVEELRASYHRWEAGTKRTDRQWIVDNFSGPAVSRQMDALLQRALA